MTRPLNLNLEGKVLPNQAGSRLVKALFIGDSQFGQTSQRLMGQIQKWSVQFEGRYLGAESQTSIGVGFSSVTGSAYGATLASTRVELGQDWGDGNVGNHFHHGRKFTVTGTISPNFSELGRSFLTAGGYALPFNRDTRKYVKVAAHDTTNQTVGGGFSRYRISEYRGAAGGNSLDIDLPATGGVHVTGREIRAAGTLGTAGNDVGIIIRDSSANDSSRSLHFLGSLIYNSPTGSEFPATGFIPFQISQSGWSAWDHINTLSTAAVDAAINMAEGFDVCFIMLGHNAEDSGVYSTNIQTLKNRIADRHTAAGRPVPSFVFIAPWLISDPPQTTRLRDQTNALYDLAASTGDGFINLFDFYDALHPSGTIATPRTTATYTLDASLVHPGDATTAEEIAKDIEWHFNPANWYTPPPSLGRPSNAVFLLASKIKKRLKI